MQGQAQTELHEEVRVWSPVSRHCGREEVPSMPRRGLRSRWPAEQWRFLQHLLDGGYMHCRFICQAYTYLNDVRSWLGAVYSARLQARLPHRLRKEEAREQVAQYEAEFITDNILTTR